MRDIMDMGNASQPQTSPNVTAIVPNRVFDTPQPALKPGHHVSNKGPIPLSARAHPQRIQIGIDQRTAKVKRTFSEAQNDKQFLSPKPNAVIEENNPIIGHRFRAREGIIAKLPHPAHNGIGGNGLQRTIQIFLKEMTAFGNGSKTRGRLQFEGHHRLNGLEAMLIACRRTFFYPPRQGESIAGPPPAGQPPESEGRGTQRDMR
jgi:hypothetical protein